MSEEKKLTVVEAETEGFCWREPMLSDAPAGTAHLVTYATGRRVATVRRGKEGLFEVEFARGEPVEEYVDEETARAAAERRVKSWERGAYLDILFSKRPTEGGEFVEVENEEGRSVNVGEWLQREEGLWALRIFRGELRG